MNRETKTQNMRYRTTEGYSEKVRETASQRERQRQKDRYREISLGKQIRDFETETARQTARKRQRDRPMRLVTLCFCIE